ncbi:malectin domain-containing carbohydrate-binding protein [Pontibacter pamirensis]|uniref:malectin domain-containing carbohydrate-binding protein n=1 Tax=Pontibacter pamirensis TaxID=2562824 RepID=UPI00138A4B5E|nr:malectin domain-containing carbohydrate-binding protein [Pontibacter pamirensis]
MEKSSYVFLQKTRNTRVLRGIILLALLHLNAYTNYSFAQEASYPSTLPEVKYHLTARPWQALNISRDTYLDRVEGIVRESAKFQNPSGAIIDPYLHREVQYATPYFAHAIGTLIFAGRAMDLLDEGVAAMNNATAKISKGASAIPDNHGEFFLAPLASAVPLYAAHVSASQLKKWESRMKKPVKEVTRGYTHNWRTYAMKGEWYRAKKGYVDKLKATQWLEDSWISTQKNRFTNNSWNFYHDDSSEPDSWPYEAAARGNLLTMVAEGYDGAFKGEIMSILKKGTQSSLLLQDPSGQGVAGGRSGNHTWNDIVMANGYETLAEIINQEGDARLAGQYRRAAALGFQSVQRWRRADGTYSVTKNHFDPAERTSYAPYSHFTNYNGYMMYHMAENYLRHASDIPEQPAPNEIGGYTLVSDKTLATAVANAGGMHMQVNLRGSTKKEHNLFWTTLGVVRFGRTGWDSRLGPSDGVRETSSRYGVSFAPTFLEGNQWVRLASIPDRYEASFTTQFAHPLLVRCRVEYRPKAGNAGPNFTNDFVITPDGILSTLTSSAPSTDYGVTWPVFKFDGAVNLSTPLTSHIASVSFPGEADEQNFIALHSSPTITATDAVRRSSYGDLQPVRMVSGTAVNATFIYPRGFGDPSAEVVRESYSRSGNDFSTLVGRVKGDTYIGRTSAGGEGASIDLNNDDVADAIFSTHCGFVLQLRDGAVTKVETDRAVTATIQGQTVNLEAYTPVDIYTAPQIITRINAGGGAFTDSLSRPWSADTYFSGGVAASRSFDVAGTTDDNLYLHYRYASSGAPLSYAIPVQDAGPYRVKLHFVEPYFGMPEGKEAGSSGDRVFHVDLEGRRVLGNYDIYAQDGAGKAVVKTFMNVSVTDGILNVDLTSLKDNAIISAIEVEKESSSAVFINAGGPFFTDSLSRPWSADTYFSGGVAASKSFDVAGTTDDNLYQHYRYASSGAPLSYAIPVQAASVYRVRLHFVEPYFGMPEGKEAGSSGDRVFHVDLEGRRVLGNYDIYAQDGAGKAVVKTFMNVSVTDGILNVDLTSLKDNAIISAIEVERVAEETTQALMMAKPSIASIKAFEENEEQELQLKMYPNPSVGDWVYLDGSNYGKNKAVMITMHDELGRALKSMVLTTNEQGAFNLRVPIDKLSRGVYFIKAQVASGSKQLKLLID